MLGVDERMVTDRRTNIGVEAECLARSDVQTLIATTLRSRNWCFEKNFCAKERIPSRRFDTCIVAFEVDLLADLDLFDIELCARCKDNVKRRIHDLRTDAVAFSYCNWSLCHWCLL